MSDTFGAMEQLIREWMRGARDQEVKRVLLLVRDELHRRGHEWPSSQGPEERQEGRSL